MWCHVVWCVVRLVLTAVYVCLLCVVIDGMVCGVKLYGMWCQVVWCVVSGGMVCGVKLYGMWCQVVWCVVPLVLTAVYVCLLCVV